MAFGNLFVLGFVFVCLRSVSCLPRNVAPSFLEVGSCASISLMEGFESEKYLGTWYTISSVPNSYIPVKKCMTDTVTMQDIDMEIVTKGFGEDDSPQSSEAVLSEVVPFNPFEEPFLQLQASLVPPVPYHIVETDYTSYSCVYSCFDLLNIRAELFFILSRTPEISPETKQRCLDLFEEKDVDTGKLVEMQQEGCPREDEGVEEEEEEEVVEAEEVAEEEVEERDEGQEVEVTEDGVDALGVLQNADEIPGGPGRMDSEVRKDASADGSTEVEGQDLENGKDSSASEAGDRGDAVISVDLKGCVEEADSELKGDGNDSPVNTQRKDERYISEEEYGLSVLEEAEDFVQEIEEDVARAVDIVENSATKLIEETSEILEIHGKDVKKTSLEIDERTRIQGIEDGDHYNSSSPPLSLPTAASVTFAALCLFLYR
ncbi:uncharacterized protein LOC134772083 [Penaeus indicus]|uniref:uncharacterized protein LOC134772083 n=1 Tax=Penaeus indicus TaxID=29960 RepID=UPI00300C0CF1